VCSWFASPQPQPGRSPGAGGGGVAVAVGVAVGGVPVAVAVAPGTGVAVGGAGVAMAVFATCPGAPSRPRPRPGFPCWAVALPPRPAQSSNPAARAPARPARAGRRDGPSRMVCPSSRPSNAGGAPEIEPNGGSVNRTGAAAGTATAPVAPGGGPAGRRLRG
jgi:hypothetical protein